jgi:hypothetical protein
MIYTISFIRSFNEETEKEQTKIFIKCNNLDGFGWYILRELTFNDIQKIKKIGYDIYNNKNKNHNNFIKNNLTNL